MRRSVNGGRPREEDGNKEWASRDVIWGVCIKKCDWGKARHEDRRREWASRDVNGGRHRIQKEGGLGLLTGLHVTRQVLVSAADGPG
eukprot:359263-Chlamydomonas_euryale.AAC.5